MMQQGSMQPAENTTFLARQANEAKLAALEEVERLLQHSEDLKRLQTLCQDYEHKAQAQKMQLSTTIASQLDTIHVGIDKIDASMRALATVQSAFQTIDELCEECAALIEHHGKIQLLSIVHGNLRKTLVDVENIAELPQEASAAEDLLQDNSRLLEAYQCLAALEGTATLAQNTLDGIEALNQQELRKLSLYFDRVKATMSRFEERVFGLLRGFLALGQTEPALLVAVVRVVEMQEHVDRQIQASAHGLEPKGYLARAEQQIGVCVAETCGPLRRAAEQLTAAAGDTGERMQLLFAQAQAMVVALTDCYDNVVPCFPPGYQAFGTIFAKFHEHLAFFVDCVGAAAATLSSNDILQMIAWTQDFVHNCGELGLSDEQAAFSMAEDAGIPLLISQYASRTYEMLHSWSVNILQADMKEQPRMAEDGRLWTPGSVDFFRTINEQVNLVEEFSTGELLLQTAQAALTVIEEYQVSQETFMRQGLTVGPLCALVNNNSRCYDDAGEFADHLAETLSDDLRDQTQDDAHKEGFLELSKVATRHISRSIFADQALRELFLKVGGGGEWLTGGGVVDTILATVEDYLGEYLAYLQPAFSSRLSATALGDTVVHYVAALLAGTKQFSEQSSAQLDADIAAMEAFFEQFAKPDKVAKLVQPLHDARGLAAADSVEGFVLGYTSLLEVYPGLEPQAVEGLVAARSDIPPPEAKQAVAECRELWAQKKGVPLPKGGSTLRLADFGALVAALAPL